MRLDITIVAHNVGSIGGMERQLAHLIEGLLDKGHRVTVLARRCELRRHPELRFIRIGGPGRPFAIAFPWFLVVGTVKAWRHRGTILHTTGALVLNRCDVTTVHFCNEAVRAREGLVRARKPSALYRANGKIALWMSRTLERFGYRPGRATRLVAVSSGVEHELARYFPLMQGRLSTIPNAVDAQEFRPDKRARSETRAQLRLGEGDLVILFAAGEWEGKGLGYAVEAVSRTTRWSLLVVGQGDRERFEAEAERLGIPDRVRFVGPTAQIARYYQAADAFVLPTGYEAFPLVVLEAAACGLPLLVTPVNGVEDMLVDGVNGLFIERDPENIRERLAALEQSASVRAAMGAAARETACAFRWEDVVDSYEALYVEIAGADRSRAPPDVATVDP